MHYYVGGNTKVYGACLPRFRAEDFGELKTHDGVSPAWPVGYEELEPYYAEAEAPLRRARQPRRGSRPTRRGRVTSRSPRSSTSRPIAALAASMTAQGLHPVHMPMARGHPPRRRVRPHPDLRRVPLPARRQGRRRRPRASGRRCVSPTVRLLTRTVVTRLHTSTDGRRVVAAAAERDGRPLQIRAAQFVVAAGAVNSAALLLRSSSDRHPRGLANSSDLVGRNYMVHNSTFFVAVDPRRRNTVELPEDPRPERLVPRRARTTRTRSATCRCSARSRGRWSSRPSRGCRRRCSIGRPSRSIDIYLTTEDLPDPDNRIVVGSDGRITVHWTPNNLAPHRELVRRVTRVVRRAGYPVVFTERMGIETNSHQCGTAVMGSDPAHQRARSAVPRPRRAEPVGRRQCLLSVVGRPQPGSDHRGERVASRRRK